MNHQRKVFSRREMLEIALGIGGVVIRGVRMAHQAGERSPRSLSVIVITLVTAWLALAVAAPAPVAAQQIALTPSKPQPIACIGRDGNLQADAISVAAHPSFAEAPYNQWPHPEHYELYLYDCASDKGPCFTRDGKPLWHYWKHGVQPCDNRDCGKWPTRLNPPRAVTVYFAAFLKQKDAYGGRWLTGNKFLAVKWTNTGQRCPEQPLPPGPAVGEDLRARFVWSRDTDGNFVINIDGQRTPPDRANLTGNFQSWRFTGQDPRTGANVMCTGGLDPGRRAAPDAPGTMRCEARLGPTVWQCQGQARMVIDWSVVAGGSAWFAIWPGNCVGTITEGGRTRPNRFGVIYVKSGLGLPLAPAR